MRGNGVRPVVTKKGKGRRNAAASLPPRSGADGVRVCSCTPSFCLPQELAEQWVVELVATATDAQKQSLFGQAAEVFSFVLIGHLPWTRKRLFTMQNFMDHLADDVLPGLIDSYLPTNRQRSNPQERCVVTSSPSRAQSSQTMNACQKKKSGLSLAKYSLTS